MFKDELSVQTNLKVNVTAVEAVISTRLYSVFSLTASSTMHFGSFPTDFIYMIDRGLKIVQTISHVITPALKLLPKQFPHNNRVTNW